MNRRITQILFSLLVIFSFLIFTGCEEGKGGSSTTPTAQNNQQPAPTPIPTPTPTPTPQPSQVTNPIPTTGALDVEFNSLLLSWVGGSNTTGYDIYLSLNANLTTADLVAQNTSQGSFQVSNLKPGNTYYWRVDAIGPGGMTRGPLWEFTTKADTPPPLTPTPPGKATNPTPAGNGGPGGTCTVTAKIIALGNPGSTNRMKVIYKLYDPNSSKADIKAEWSQDGGTTWNPCTQYVATGQPNPLLNGDPVANLNTSPTGTTHIFVWDMAQETNLQLDKDVKVRVIPSCKNGVGTSEKTGSTYLAGWSTPIEITQSVELYPIITVGYKDQLQVVFTDLTGNAPSLHSITSSDHTNWSASQSMLSPAKAHRPRTPAKDWSATGFVAFSQDPQKGVFNSWGYSPTYFGTNEYARNPVIARESKNGRIFLIWSDSPGSGQPNQIFYNIKTSGYWFYSLQISNCPGGADFPAIEVDSQDTMHIVWSEKDSGGSQGGIWYCQYRNNPPDHGKWSAPQKIFSQSGSSETYIAIDSINNLHVVWQGNKTSGSETDIFYAKFDGTWSTPANLSNSTGSARHPHIITDFYRRLHVVWDDDSSGAREVYYSQFDDAVWSPPARVSNSSLKSETPYIAIDTEKNLHLVWVDSDLSTSKLCYSQRRYKKRMPLLISESLMAEYPEIAIDSKDNLHVVWEGMLPGTTTFDIMDNREIYYAKYDGEKWSSPLILSKSPNDNSRFPRIVVDHTDQVHVVWEEKYSGISRYFAYCKFDGQNWTNPVKIPGSELMYSRAHIAVDFKNHLHVVWTKVGYLNWNILHTEFDGTTWSGLKYFATLSESPPLGAVADKNNTLHVIWTERGRTLYHFQLAENATAATYTTIPRASGTTFLDENITSVVLDTQGNIQAIWSLWDRSSGYSGYQGTHYRKFDGISWSQPEKFYGYGSFHMYNNVLSIGSDGNLHMVWGSDGLSYNCRSQGIWTGVVDVFDYRKVNWGYHSPKTVVDSLGNLHCVWHEGSYVINSYKIYYSPLPAPDFKAQNFMGTLPSSWSATSLWSNQNPGSRRFLNWTEEFMIADSNYFTTSPMDETLTSETYDCSQYTIVYLKFESYFTAVLGNQEEVAEVEVSADGGKTWQRAMRMTEKTDSCSGKIYLNISHIASGKSQVKVRFRYYNALYDGWWGIDNVELRGDKYSFGYRP